MLRDILPTDDELAALNLAHAPNGMGHTLLQRVCMQLTHDCVEAARSGDIEKSRALAFAAGKLEGLAYAASFEDAYRVAFELLGNQAPKSGPSSSG